MLSVSASMELDSGQPATVSRRLTSSSRGWYQAGETHRDLGNSPLSFLGRLSREAFLEVYAIGARDLEFFRDRVWREVQGGLVPGLAPEFLMPIEEVLASLEKEANTLWKPTRHKGTKAQTIQASIRDLKEERRKAQERDAVLRDNTQRLSEIERSKKDLSERIVFLKAFLMKAERFMPVYQALRKVEELSREAGDVTQLEAIPESPREFIAGREERLEELLARSDAIEGAMKEHQESVSSLDSLLEGVLHLEARIQEARNRLEAWANDRVHLEDARIEAAGVRARLEEVATGLLTGTSNLSFLRTLPRAEILAAIRGFEEAHSRLRSEEERLGDLEVQVAAGHRPVPVLALLGVILALGLAGSGLLMGMRWLTASGAILGGLCLAILARWNQAREENRRLSRGLDVARSRRDEAASARDEYRRRVVCLLGPAPIAQGRLEAPDTMLFQDLMEAREQAVRQEALDARMDMISGRLSQGEQQVKELAREIGIQFKGTGEALEEICMLLAKAREKARSQEASLQAIETLKKEKEDVKRESEAIKKALDDIRSQLAQVHGGGSEAAIREVGRRRDAARQARRMEEDLSSKPDLDTIKEEIAELEAKGETWLFSDEEVVRNRQELAEILEREVSLKEEAARIQAALAYAQGPTVDDIDSQVDSLKMELEESLERRDRLVIMRAVLVEAERRFREEHQPDVLRRASAHLKRITDGCYEALTMDEEGGRPCLTLHTARGFPVPVAPPISRGTLDQIYLALRLSLADHLDDQSETLPIFLDEVLVNWGDGSRLEEGIGILQEVSSSRQVFLFTCHDWLVKRLERGGARAIDLLHNQ
jgi:uncharacterized protein YhaN